MDREVGGRGRRRDSMLTRTVNAIFRFLKYAEFEMLFVFFFFIAFFLFKDLTARPEYNQILVKKPGGPDFLAY